MRFFGEALHEALTIKDRQGTAYMVKVNDGPPQSVIQHWPQVLVLQDQNTTTFVNLNQTRTVEIEEI